MSDVLLQDKFSQELLRAISAIHEKFASLASKSLSERLRSTVNISIASLDQLFMEEFFRVIPIPSSLGVISTLNGSAILQIDNDIKVAIINKLCDSDDELIKPLDGETGIGEKIMKYIYSRLLENLQEAWAPVTDLRPKLEKIEYDSKFSNDIAPPKEWVLVVTFEAKIEDPAMKPLSGQGMMNLCIPYPVIEPILEKL
jgi:flagellar motor switch protein FliM